MHMFSSLTNIFQPCLFSFDNQNIYPCPIQSLDRPFSLSGRHQPAQSSFFLITRKKKCFERRILSIFGFFGIWFVPRKNIKVIKNGGDIFTWLQENPILWKKMLSFKNPHFATPNSYMKWYVIYQLVSTHT